MLKLIAQLLKEANIQFEIERGDWMTEDDEITLPDGYSFQVGTGYAALGKWLDETTLKKYPYRRSAKAAVNDYLKAVA